MHCRKALMLPQNASTTIAMKKSIESHWNGFFKADATFGRKREVSMPSTSGIPRSMNMVLKTSQSGMLRVGISLATSA